jgi:hypothetical protein
MSRVFFSLECAGELLIIIVLKREKGWAPYKHHHLTPGRAVRGCFHYIVGTKTLDN